MNFTKLLNIFEGRQNESLVDLLQAPPEIIVEHNEVSYKQYNNIVMRWAIHIIRDGLKTLQKKYAVMKSHLTSESLSKLDNKPDMTKNKKREKNSRNNKNSEYVNYEERNLESIRQYGILIKKLSNIKFKSLNSLNASICHVIFLFH